MPSMAFSAETGNYAIRGIAGIRHFTCRQTHPASSPVLLFNPCFSCFLSASSGLFSVALCKRISPSSLPLLLLKLVLAYPSVMPSGSPVNLVQSPFFLYASFPVLLPDVV